MQTRLTRVSPVVFSFAEVAAINEVKEKTTEAVIGSPRIGTRWEVQGIVLTYLRAVAGWEHQIENLVAKGNLTVSVDVLLDSLVLLTEIVSFDVNEQYPPPPPETGTTILASPFVLHLGSVSIPGGHQLSVRIRAVISNFSNLETNPSNGMMAGLFVSPNEHLERGESFPTLREVQSGLVTAYDIVPAK